MKEKLRPLTPAEKEKLEKVKAMLLDKKNKKTDEN